MASVAVEVPPRARTSPTIGDRGTYICPAGKELTSTGTLVNDGTTPLYRASKYNCEAGELKPRCYPKTPARASPTGRPPRATDTAIFIQLQSSWAVLTKLGKRVVTRG
jgi:hypothetical protein